MTPPLNREQLDEFAAALVLEIKAEMGRRDLSSRGLGKEIGRSSQYVSSRLDGGNPTTGKRVALTVSDVASIASAFGMEPYELMANAQEAMTRKSAKIVRLPAFDDEVPFDENDSRMAARDLDQPSEGAADRDRQDVDAEAADSDGPEHGA